MWFQEYFNIIVKEKRGINYQSSGREQSFRWMYSTCWELGSQLSINKLKGENLELVLERRPTSTRLQQSLSFVFKCYCSVVSRCLKGPQRLKPWLSSSVGEQVSNFISWNEVLCVLGLKHKRKCALSRAALFPSRGKNQHLAPNFLLCFWLVHSSPT